MLVGFGVSAIIWCCYWLPCIIKQRVLLVYTGQPIAAPNNGTYSKPDQHAPSL